MAFSRLTAYVLLVFALAEASSLLQRAANRQRTFTGLRYSPQDPAARTILALDTNSDGLIDPKEIAAFARKQGLDDAAATEEFASIDSNGDGVLNSVELASALGGSATAALATEGESEETAAARPVATDPAPVTLRSATKQQASAAKMAVTPPKQEAPATAVAAPALVKASPSMAADSADDHSSATAFSAPVGAQGTNLDTTELISEESRRSVQKAAQQVADELALVEKEEREARDLDRKAAEVRANATALAKTTAEDALDAGAQAAHAKAAEMMEKITKLEQQAQRAEVRAAALQAKSKMELEDGNELMKAANEALSQSSAEQSS